MSLAAMVRRMSEAGAPAEAIAIALEEIEALQSALDARRLAARDRKRAQRERNKEPQESANVTGQSQDNGVTVTDNPSPLNPPPKKAPHTPKNNPPLISPQPDLLRSRNLPDWLDKDAWAAFVRMRKAIPKVAFTEDAAKGVLRELTKLKDQGYCPVKTLEAAVIGGWRSVYAREENRISAGNPAKPLTTEELERAIRFRRDHGDEDGARKYEAELAERRAA